MKKLFKMSIFPALMLFLSTSLQAQSIDGVISSLKSGNASELTNNVGDNMILTLSEKSNTYSKSQAAQILKEFFGKSTVKGFDLKHKGNSPTGSYAIGTLQTSGGNYRVNIFMRKEKSAEVIKELRFQLIE